MGLLSRIDLRAGSLTGTGGFSSLGGANSGSIAVDTSDPGVGVYAADWPSIADAYGVETIAATSEVWVWIYLVLDTAPASDQTVLQVRSGGTPVGEIDITTSRTLLLKNNGTQIGSASSALTLGTLYRIGLRQKVGTGADAELEAYLAEKHKDLVSFSSSSAESFTANADEIRVGAVDAVAFDGRVGLLMARDDMFAGSWLDVHDIVVGPLGFMRHVDSTIAFADMQPAYDRAAIGERQHESYQNMSYVALANFSGGVGQSRMRSSDRTLTGIFDGRFEGYAFPPRKLHTESNGGAVSYYFDRGSTLYGITATQIQVIGSATAYSIPADLQDPRHQPTVDGQGNVYWVSSSNKIAKWTGSGSPSDVTPAGYVPNHVSQYERFIWAFADSNVPALTLVQDKYTATTNSQSSSSVSFASTPLESPYTVCLAVLIVGGGGTPLTVTGYDSNWTELGYSEITDELAIHVFEIWGGGIDAASFYATFDNINVDRTLYIAEFQGADPDTARQLTFETVTAAEALTSLTVTGADGDWQFAGVANESSLNPAVESGWTVAEQSNSAGGNAWEINYRFSTDSAIQWTGLDSASDKVGFHLALGTAPNAGEDLFVILASDDAGETWSAAPQNYAMDLFGAIRASVATAGSLWLVTDRGLFEMVARGDETTSGTTIIVNSITQADKWERPLADNAGKWVASFQGQIYYPVGSTIRRFTPNSQDPNEERAFWPTAEWATVADDIQALVSNEGGIWWGSASYLWNFNGRGFHQVAAEGTAGDLDTMYWHGGNLYVKGDPAKYYKYGYPTIRPDVLIDQGVLTQDDFDTGYIITPSIDFEKVTEPKILRKMYSQVSFTDQANTSGQIDWHYRNGCGTDADPGLGSGGDLSATWTSWGTHDFDDGGFHELSLANPLQCFRLYVRATLTPGSTGIPVLHFFSLWGHAKMRSQKRVVVPAVIHTGQYDKENNIIFDEYGQVQAMLRTVNTMREDIDPANDLTWTLYRKDGSDGGREYRVLFSQIEDGEIQDSEDQRRLTHRLTMAFEELPA